MDDGLKRPTQTLGMLQDHLLMLPMWEKEVVYYIVNTGTSTLHEATLNTW
jgi:hypothetical protein